MSERLRETYERYGQDVRKSRAWDSRNPGNAAIRNELTRAVREIAGETLARADRVLDIGCGTGWWLETLGSLPEVHAELHGVDLLPERAKAAGERVQRARVSVADALSLPYENGAFQAVFLLSVLSSLERPASVTRALLEAGRMLAPGGMLIVWEPRIVNPTNPHTLHVSRRLLREALPSDVCARSITVLPALARRLGSRTQALYPRLGRIPLLRTHRLLWYRRNG